MEAGVRDGRRDRLSPAPPIDPDTAPERRRAFIRAHTRLWAPPHVPEIVLHLADEATDLWEKTEEELGALGVPPPFWAFAWAGGQALARYLLDHPGTVAGQSVHDFASGSGLVAIAAAKAGARSVIASEIDAFAVAAIGLNAGANATPVQVHFGDLLSGPVPDVDVLLAGDVFYEEPMGKAVLAWLDRARAAGTDVLVGDPGRSYLPRERLEPVAEYSVEVTRALEDCEIKRTTVWRLKPPLRRPR